MWGPPHVKLYQFSEVFEVIFFESFRVWEPLKRKEKEKRKVRLGCKGEMFPENPAHQRIILFDPLLRERSRRTIPLFDLLMVIA